MACFASHYECWKKVHDLPVDLTSKARGYVVLEDDALIKLELPQQSKSDHNCITLLGGDFHTLSYWDNKLSANEMDDVLGFMKVCKWGKNHMPKRLQWACSQAYYLPVAIAREIVDHIDILLRKHEKHALRATDNFLSQWVGSCFFPTAVR